MDCQQGKHALIAIHSQKMNFGALKVTRWCENCGAVVIDKDVDGRTSPGYYMDMEVPNILIEENESVL